MSQSTVWQEIKGKLISRYKTLSRASHVLKCHPNALRKAAEGTAPKVRARMAEKGIL
jgi:hypothetical protein